MYPLGVFFIVSGVRRYRRPFSSWYLIHTPGGVNVAYAGVPLGLGSMMWGFLGFWQEGWSAWIFYFFFFGGVITVIVGMYISVNYFEPSWLKWLKQELGDLYPVFVSELAQKHGWDYTAPDRYIKNRQDLEKVMDEFRRNIIG